MAVEGSPDDEAGRARLGPDRWESYRRLGRELRYRELAAESGAAAAERKRWRWVHEEVERLGRAVARGRRAPEGAP